MSNFGNFTAASDLQDTDKIVGHRGTSAGAERGWTWALFKSSLAAYLSTFFAPLAHALSTSNPHAVTKAQVNLGNVTDDAQIKAANLDTDATMAANSNTRVPSQAAVRANCLRAAMPLATSDAGAAGQYAVDATKRADYVPGTGWVFVGVYQI